MKDMGEPRTSRVHLRAPQVRDLPVLEQWRSDPQAQLDLMLRVTKTDRAEVESWIARRTSDPEGDFRLVAAAEDDRAVGFVQLTKIHRASRRASLGLYVDPSVRGTGLASDALARMEQVARDQHGLRTIHLEVLVENERALRFWEAQGYRRTGTLPDHYTREGRTWAVALFEKQLET